MGKTIEKKLIILALIFLVTGLLVYGTMGRSERVAKGLVLREYMENMDSYAMINPVTLEENVFQFLDLDDYTFASYGSPSGPINLFIGYYYTADKVSAAHSPLACFPGQGWVITEPQTHQLTIADHTIHYAEIIATLEDQKELVLYWYQAAHDTTPHVYRNKINTLYNKLTINDEQHAFVRVTVPLMNTTYDQAKKAGLDFIAAFYPRFLRFIDGDGAKS